MWWECTFPKHICFIALFARTNKKQSAPHTYVHTDTHTYMHTVHTSCPLTPPIATMYLWINVFTRRIFAHIQSDLLYRKNIRLCQICNNWSNFLMLICQRTPFNSLATTIHSHAYLPPQQENRTLFNFTVTNTQVTPRHVSYSSGNTSRCKLNTQCKINVHAWLIFLTENKPIWNITTCCNQTETIRYVSKCSENLSANTTHYFTVTIGPSTIHHDINAGTVFILHM